MFAVPFAAEGVVLPLLGVAGALSVRGHHVYFVCPSSFHRRARLAGCFPLLMPLRNEWQSFTATESRRRAANILWTVTCREVPYLLRIISRIKPDLIVLDPLNHIGGVLAALKADVPWVSIAGAPWQLDPEFQNVAGTPEQVAQLRKRLGLPASGLDPTSQCISPHLHLMGWTREFDCGVPPPQAVHVGPLAWDQPNVPQPRWFAELRHDVPFVLASTTTYALRRFERAERAYFSAVVDALRGMTVDAVVTMSGRTTVAPTGAGSHVRFARFLPHHLLMSRASAVVTHGGWGVVGRALRQGVPMVLVPFGWDHPINARMVESVGAGIVVPLSKLGGSALRQAVLRVLDPRAPERARARKLAAGIRRLDTYGLAVRTIEALLLARPRSAASRSGRGLTATR